MGCGASTQPAAGESVEVQPAAMTPSDTRNGSCDNAELLKAQKANEDLSRENKKLAEKNMNFERLMKHKNESKQLLDGREKAAARSGWFRKKPMPVAQRRKGDLCTIDVKDRPQLILAAFNCEQLEIPDSGSMVSSICNTYGQIWGQAAGSLKKELERKNAMNETLPGSAEVYQVGASQWIGIVYMACTYGDCEGAMSVEISRQVRINWFEGALKDLGQKIMKLDPKPLTLGVSSRIGAGVNKGSVEIYQKHMINFAPQFPDLEVSIWERNADNPQNKVTREESNSNIQEHEHEYDLCVVGGGPAGWRAAVQAATLMQKRVCIVDGCHRTQSAVDASLPDALGAPSGMPSKALRSAVIDHLLFKDLHDKSREARYAQCSEDWGAIMQKGARMLQKFDEINKADLKKAGVKLFAGWGSFVDENTLSVQRNSKKVGTVGADRFLICSGATRMWPDGSEYKGRVTAEFPKNDKRFMTTDQVNVLDFLPKRLAVIGTGITAMEFAAIFAKCGTKVTIIGDEERALAETDQEIKDVVLKCLKKNGVEIQKIDRQEEYVDVDGETDARKAISIRNGGNEVLCVDALIYAGRGIPNTKHLKLDTVGVKTNRQGYIQTKENYKTDNHGISAAGDCQKGGLASAAVVAAELAVSHLLKAYLVTGQKEALDAMPSAIWTMPENAFVGQTTEQLVNAGKVDGQDFESSKGYFADTAKWALRTPHEINEATILDSTERENAFIKILFHPKSREVYGIHIVGPTAAELIQYADSCIGKPLDFILRTAPTAVTLCCAFADAALAGKLPHRSDEAMDFREPYEFMKNFLSFDRNDRMDKCSEAFSNPASAEDRELLEKTIAELEKDPQDEDEQRRVLTIIYEIWNRSLVHLEETEWQNQAPGLPNQALPSNAIVAVVGGKHTDGFRGTGDWIVSLLLETKLGHLFSHSRSAGDAASEGITPTYEHIQNLGELVKAVAKKKAENPSAPVVFVYTIGLTLENGQNKANNDFVQAFVDELSSNGLLNNKDVKVLHTSTFHASPKCAHHEDNIADNYGLADYGASKVMQTVQLAEALYTQDSKVMDEDVYVHLTDLKSKLNGPLDKARAHWDANSADATARICPEGFLDVFQQMISTASEVAGELYEDTGGSQSVIRRLQEKSNRLAVVKLPYMLSNTAVYRSSFVFNTEIRGGKSAWEFFKLCSFKRFRIVMSPKRAAVWHIAAVQELLLDKEIKSRRSSTAGANGE